MKEAGLRSYHPADVVRFRKTTEPFGGLSNMAPGYPLQVLNFQVRTTEALYQACRFPHLPEVQRAILAEASPMTLKMRSKPLRSQTRPGWERVRVPIMKWCLRVKVAHNWEQFGSLLLETGDRPIVEDSKNDAFWGAVKKEDGLLHGSNVLGRLLMELRDIFSNRPEELFEILPVNIPDFRLDCRDIPPIQAKKALSKRQADMYSVWQTPHLD